MSAFTTPGIEAIYYKVIDETIAEATSLQSSAVLEQLKYRWLEKLQERLESQWKHSQSRTARRSTGSFESSVNSTKNESDPKSENDRDSMEKPTFSQKSALDNDYEKNMEYTVGFSDIPTEQTKSQLTGNHNTISVVQNLGEKNKEKEDNDDDDEWSETEWQPALPQNIKEDDISEKCEEKQQTVDSSTKADSLTKVESSKILQLPEKVNNYSQTTNDAQVNQLKEEQTKINETIQDIDVEVMQKASGKRPLENYDQRLCQRGRGVTVTTEEDLYNDEDIIDEETLSDLDDEEPECSDLIVAQFHSVQRPHTRKAYQKGLWRIKLKHGILQINGKEIIFNSMSGDLLF